MRSHMLWVELWLCCIGHWEAGNNGEDMELVLGGEVGDEAGVGLWILDFNHVNLPPCDPHLTTCLCA